MDIVFDMEETIPSTPPHPRPGRPLCQRLLRSEDLLGQARKVIILLGGNEYVLQVTRSGKLLLTK